MSAQTPPRKKTRVHIKRSVILDPIHPRDYNALKIVHYCEQCSHFAHASQSCTIGYDASKHTQAAQKHNYELYGKVAFCRFMEID